MRDHISHKQRVHPFHSVITKRKYKRQVADGLRCDVTDGASVYSGMIADISLGGFKLINMPVSFKGNMHMYKIVISGKDHHYKLLGKPCWKKSEDPATRQYVGFKILDAPLEWVSLTLESSH